MIKDRRLDKTPPSLIVGGPSFVVGRSSFVDKAELDEYNYTV